jgi:hypothetical protein
MPCRLVAEEEMVVVNQMKSQRPEMGVTLVSDDGDHVMMA